MIRIENVTKSFPSVVALNNVSLEIRQREFFGLLGPNGAGKTTLMNLLVGYLNPDAGKITVAGLSCPIVKLSDMSRLRQSRFCCFAASPAVWDSAAERDSKKQNLTVEERTERKAQPVG